MARTTTVQSLANTDLCRGLSEAEARVIFHLSEEVPLEAGQVLFKEGDKGDAVFVVVSGEVEVLKRSQAGQERTLAKLSPGAVVGEMSLISSSPRSASARASSAAMLLRIPSPAFQGLVNAGSVAALKMVHNFAQVLSKRLAAVDERLINLMGEASGERHEQLSDFQKLLNNWSF
jgi:CRP-like cAMP-binding protein